MKLSQIAINAKAEESGRWMPASGLLGVDVKVRGVNNSAARAKRAKVAEQIGRKKLSDAEAEALHIDVIAETILLDWRGIENEDGTPLTCDDESKRALLGNPDMRLLREAVVMAATLVGEDDLAAAEQDAKN